MDAIAACEGPETTATSGTFVGGEMAGALFVLWKTAISALFNGAWATPRRFAGLKVGHATDAEDLSP